jgi:dipeptidyl aminopeptidase/acylaminoacyl peptidase
LIGSQKETDCVAGLRRCRLPGKICSTAPSRSGGKIGGRVWLPAGIAHPPLVVFGPASLAPLPASDTFDPLVQTLVANGLAVAKFDGRGTFGYARDGDIMTSESPAKVVREDIEDGVAGLVAQGLIDGKQVGLLAEGIGGALALAVAEQSDKFRAVVSINAPLEIERMDLLMISSDSSELVLAERFGGWSESAKVAHALSPIKIAPRLGIPALHLMDEARWTLGKPSDDAKKLKKALDSVSSSSRVELAYSWFQGFTPPSVDGRERATVALRIAEFLQANLAAK